MKYQLICQLLVQNFELELAKMITIVYCAIITTSLTKGFF